MSQKWFQKASVQASLVSAFAIVVVATVPIYHLNESNLALQRDIDAKIAEIQRLETQLTPFRTIALERYGGTEVEALYKLALRIKGIESAVCALQNYSEVAKLNCLGLTGTVAYPLVESSPLSVLLEGCYTNTENNLQALQTPEAEKKYLEAINISPEFPFPYCEIALSYKAQGKENWREYAIKGLEILDKTTTVKGHHPHHDLARARIKSILSQ